MFKWFCVSILPQQGRGWGGCAAQVGCLPANYRRRGSVNWRQRGAAWHEAGRAPPPPSSRHPSPSSPAQVPAAACVGTRSVGPFPRTERQHLADHGPAPAAPRSGRLAHRAVQKGKQTLLLLLHLTRLEYWEITYKEVLSICDPQVRWIIYKC